ncbi:MAG: hypothetical protein JW715_14890 [Sedimentisphaerales bacterium]|nr:hypothetical protein [Sedimentisphaerales bacterium]
MCEFYFHIFLLSGNDDLEKWVNILFVVVLAVVWAIGGFLKSRAEQAKFQKNKQSRPELSGSSNKGRDPAELILEKILGPYSRTSGSHNVPTGTRISKKPPFSQPPGKMRNNKLLPQKVSQRQKFFKTGRPKPFVKEQPVVSDIQILPEKIADVTPQKEYKKLERQSEVSAIYGMLDLNDADSLKKAILYYEVLGKPLSLREPSNL